MGRDTECQGLYGVDADGPVDVQLDWPTVSISLRRVQMRWLTGIAPGLLGVSR